MYMAEVGDLQSEGNRSERFFYEGDKILPPAQKIDYDQLPALSPDQLKSLDKYSSPNIIRWLNSLEDAVPTDQSEFNKLTEQSKILDFLEGQRPEVQRIREMPFNERNQLIRETRAKLNEVGIRVDNQHLKDWLPKLVRDIIAEPDRFAWSEGNDPRNQDGSLPLEVLHQVSERVRSGDIGILDKMLKGYATLAQSQCDGLMQALRQRGYGKNKWEPLPVDTTGAYLSVVKDPRIISEQIQAHFNPIIDKYMSSPEGFEGLNKWISPWREKAEAIDKVREILIKRQLLPVDASRAQLGYNDPTPQHESWTDALNQTPFPQAA
jgi:hypothetical protein